MGNLIKIAFIACLCTNYTFAADKKPEKKIAEVFVQEIKKESFEQISEYPIVLKSRADSKIKSPINGVVADIKKKLGDTVQENEVIAILRQQQGGFDYQPLKVRSPIAGKISNINVHRGEYVNIGDLVIEVLDPTEIYGRIEVPVRDHKIIQPNQPVKIELQQVNKLDVKGKVAGISSAADPMTGTLSADVEILDKDEFPIGIIGHAKVNRGAKEVMLIQESALNYKGDDIYVKIVDDKNLVTNRSIKIGGKKAGKVEVLDGLKTDEQIIVRSNGFVAPGDEVKIVRKKE
tara:strand:- start:26794 stop:27663 length:870 start_codon:yes stop_codon:yes gene_type:complete